MSPRAIARVVVTALSAVALSGCGKVRGSECQRLIDEVALHSQKAMLASATPDAFRTSLNLAAEAVGAVQVDDVKLREYRDRYARAVREVIGTVNDEERNRAAMDRVSSATMYALGDVNLICSGER